MSRDSKTDEEFERIVAGFNEKTPLEQIGEAARSAELARVSALNANRILSDMDIPVEVKTDALLALDSCENVIRSIAAYVGEAQ